MSKNLLKLSVISALLGLASTSFSSQVTFINGSSGKEIMNVAYKTVIQDTKQTLMQNKTLNVPAGTAIHLNLGSHHSVGIVPISVNGHPIIVDNDFRAADTCAVMFDNNNSSAKLTLTYFEKTANHKAYISCSKEINS